jgi:hypothetical protein
VKNGRVNQMRIVAVVMGMALLAATQAEAACNSGRNPSVLDVSHDLRRLNIASQNMKPGNPGFDVTPLLEKAITYAAANGCTKVIGDTGTYFFRTSWGGNSQSYYISLDGDQNLSLDFSGSTFIFKQPGLTAVQAKNCTNCIIRGMAIDYSILPFTQLAVQKIDQQNQVVVVKPFPGYANLAQLAKVQPYATEYVAFDLRQTAIRYAVGGDKLTIPSSQADRIPLSSFATPLQAGAILPGDILIVSARGGGPAIFVEGSQQVTIDGVTIYTSAGPAIEANASNNVSIDHLLVEPRPGTGRLADVAAGGVELNDMGCDNAVRQSVIIRAQDDSIAGNVSTPCGGSSPNKLIVVGNKIMNSYLARGIAFTSVVGANVTQNTILGTQQAGIYFGGVSSSSSELPTSNIQITNNALTDTNMGPAGVGAHMLGAIEVMYYDNSGQAVTDSPNSNVFISNNTISTTMRSAIWMGNVNVGAVNQNTVSAFALSGGSLGYDSHLNNGLKPFASCLFKNEMVGWYDEKVGGVIAASASCISPDTGVKQ